MGDGYSFHRPHSFDDDDDPRPLRRGDLKQIKQRLSQHAKKSGNEEMATRMWKNQSRPRPRPKE